MTVFINVLVALIVSQTGKKEVQPQRRCCTVNPAIMREEEFCNLVPVEKIKECSSNWWWISRNGSIHYFAKSADIKLHLQKKMRN